MKIALVGPLDSPVKKNASAGSEIWTYNFAEQLKMRGISPSLYAASGSEFSGELITTVDYKDLLESDGGDISKTKFAFFSISEMVRVVHDQARYDLIHLSVYSLTYYLPLIELIAKPIIATLHGLPFKKEDAKILLSKIPKINFAVISNSLLTDLERSRNYKVIYNGINLPDFPFAAGKRKYFFWMGRISKEKGVEDAIKFAQKIKEELIIAGPIRDEEYFNQFVKPNLNSKIRYVGGLGLKEKVKYYQGAKAFLMPIKWEEPFGLVAIEAMACGTPVIAYDRGALPEIISAGSDGFIVKPNEVEGLIKAAKKIIEIDRKKCREKVEKHFTLEKMVDEYLNYYKEIMKIKR